MTGYYDHAKAAAFKKKDAELLERMFDTVGDLSTTESNTDVLKQLLWQHVFIRNHRERGPG